MVDTTLEHTAAMTMSGHLNAVRGNGIVDELTIVVNNRNSKYVQNAYLVIFWCQLV